MAITRVVGFDCGNISAEPIPTSGDVGQSFSGSGMSIDGSIFRTGTGSLKAVAVSGSSGSVNIPFSTGGGTDLYRQIYIRVTNRPSTTARIIAGSTASINLRLNPDGTIAYYSGTTLIGTSTTALTNTAIWYRIAFRQSSGTSVTCLVIDGSIEVTGSPTSSAGTTLGPNDTVADTYTVYYDDLVDDNAAIPPEGAVVLLVPVSDNARDTLWTGGAGGTTSLYDAVNNKPPIGTASETNLTQIEHAGGAGGTTDRYDADMTKYSDAGIGAGDTVNAVFPWTIHGEDIATGTKLLSFNIHSNPSTSNTGSFDVAPTSGALGTWSTGWFMKTGPLGLSPSIDVAVSPVFRVIRPETASRVASVCFMGIYVHYTPAPPSSGQPFRIRAQGVPTGSRRDRPGGWN